MYNVQLNSVYIVEGTLINLLYMYKHIMLSRQCMNLSYMYTHVLYSVQGRVHEGTSCTCTSTYLRQLWGSLSWKQYIRVSSIFIQVRFVFNLKGVSSYVISSLTCLIHNCTLYQMTSLWLSVRFAPCIFYFNCKHFLFVYIVKQKQKSSRIL